MQSHLDLLSDWDTRHMLSFLSEKDFTFCLELFLGTPSV